MALTVSAVISAINQLQDQIEWAESKGFEALALGYTEGKAALEEKLETLQAEYAIS